MSYTDKLRDPRWQRMRLEVFQRDGFKCVVCSRTDKELQVHHRCYGARDPWNYTLDELATTCRDCHEMVETVLRIIRYNPEEIRFVVMWLHRTFKTVESFKPLYEECQEWANEVRAREAERKKKLELAVVPHGTVVVEVTGQEAVGS